MPAFFSRFRAKRLPVFGLLFVGVCVGLFLPVGVFSSLFADEIRLNNGVILRGNSRRLAGVDGEQVKTFLKNVGEVGRNQTSAGGFRNLPVIEVNDRVRKYYFSRKQVAADGIKIEQQLPSAFDSFKIPQPKSRHDQIRLRNLRGVRNRTSFDENGHREITVLTTKKTHQVIQGITFLHPLYVEVEGLNYKWNAVLDTKSISPKVIKSLLESVTDANSSRDQRAIARFYLQADMVYEAYRFLESIKGKFPELKKTFDQVGYDVRQQVAQKIFNEVQNRRDVGQYELAYLAGKDFQTKKDISPEMQISIQKFMQSYKEDHNRLTSTPIDLATLQGSLKNDDHLQLLNSIRSLICDNLTLESLRRLDSFNQLHSDEGLGSEEKLALAYSGWLLGSESAITELDVTLRLWEAKFLIDDYLRSEGSLERENLLNQIKSIESLNAERLEKLLEHLPPSVDNYSIQAGEQLEYEFVDSQGDRLQYTVLLPLEYSPYRSYPLLIGLPYAGQDREQATRFWGGDQEFPGETLRRGYILVVPNFHATNGVRYDHTVPALERIRLTLNEARKRFTVNSDKIFIGGVGDGGDAAIDMALKHPDLFAGVISIKGSHHESAKFYWQNGHQLPWYMIGGEYDGRSITILNQILQNRGDLIYAQFPNRVSESYREELPRVFDWMALQTRKLDQFEVEYQSFLPTDEARVDWIACRGLENHFQTTRKPTIPLNAKFTSPKGSTTTLSVLRSLATHHTFWISPKMHDFNKELVLKVKGRRKLKEFITPDLGVMLEDFRVRGDRQHIYWAKFEF